ncbi:uncharacterized protein B0H18DRAFT_1031496 [Fomitopsis serialis]|uniref:uncharacterized protein n=1 Tax=Fomitopsis serialis TaxID=139415 RepID=UPI0020079D81|nr:uncharacterized protein B0H18DRAFT_1031496 [Neoantrodia serialis]KAH9918307.1 hypothetical protein B0H18DRAFT_1031496 [Neoantrodia serialis]
MGDEIGQADESGQVDEKLSTSGTEGERRWPDKNRWLVKRARETTVNQKRTGWQASGQWAGRTRGEQDGERARRGHRHSRPATRRRSLYSWDLVDWTPCYVRENRHTAPAPHVPDSRSAPNTQAFGRCMTRRREPSAVGPPPKPVLRGSSSMYS